MALKLIAYGVTDLLLLTLLLGFTGLLNLTIRRPFLEDWRRRATFFIPFMVGSTLYDVMPAGWRLPVAIGGGLLVLAVMIWVMHRPRLCRRPTDTGAGRGAV